MVSQNNTFWCQKLGSNPGPGVTCGLSLLLVLVLAPKVFLGVLRLSFLHENQTFQSASWDVNAIIMIIVVVLPLSILLHISSPPDWDASQSPRISSSFPDSFPVLVYNDFKEALFRQSTRPEALHNNPSYVLSLNRMIWRRRHHIRGVQLSPLTPYHVNSNENQEFWIINMKLFSNLFILVWRWSAKTKMLCYLIMLMTQLEETSPWTIVICRELVTNTHPVKHFFLS